ncbi:MAG: hypothetical protein J6U92_00525, partial [Clostridia bacterium]|nr:hypothetical protein [Clostridia bacterium]
DFRAFYKHGDLHISKFENAVDYCVDKANKTVTLTAKTYVHAVELEGEAVFSDNGFSMLKGETRKVAYDLLTNDSKSEITIETYNLNILV